MAAAWNLTGKVALITGGAQGIGLDTAQRLHARGASVVLADIDDELARKEAAQLSAASALGLSVDVTERPTIDAAIARTLEHFGALDILMANAGVAPPVESLRRGDPTAFDRVLDINLTGVINTVRAGLPALLDSDGYVLIVSSLYAVINGALSMPYAMSKCAVEAMGRALRVELSGTGVDVGVAYYGFIDTKLVRDAFVRPGIAELRSAFPKWIANPVPVGRAGQATTNGIERRAARITAPGWVRATLPLRGMLQYLDGRMARDPKLRAAVGAAEG
ncbi:MAG TPA: short-chain dehydrogenase/reductase [Acidimicrobiia bacterium]|nr:short-chain dehydrogenase/reductase [Acidimicrobiia bacterium]